MSDAMAAVYDRINYQKSALPVMYGDVDFTLTPERFTDDPQCSSATNAYLPAYSNASLVNPVFRATNTIRVVKLLRLLKLARVFKASRNDYDLFLFSIQLRD